ncbi:MAG: thioredoxin fold domain-containing protein [Balneolaceae bacterium]
MLKRILTYAMAILGAVIFLQPSMAQNNSEADPDWYAFDEARELATLNDKHLFLFFEAEWCGFCKQMRNEVLPLKEIRSMMNKYFYPVSIDIESESELTYKGRHMNENSFSHLMRINATPTIIFMDGNGEVKGIQPGFLNESDLEELMIYIGEGYIETMEFSDFKKKNLAGESE